MPYRPAKFGRVGLLHMRTQSEQSQLQGYLPTQRMPKDISDLTLYRDLSDVLNNFNVSLIMSQHGTGDPYSTGSLPAHHHTGNW
jgi:hypothetical protein